VARADAPSAVLPPRVTQMVDKRSAARRTVLVLSGILAASALAVGVLRHDGLSADRTPSRPGIEVQRVAMDGTRFTPPDVEVELGATVVWTNADPFPHNVDTGGTAARSGDLAPGQSWSFRPRERGTVAYRCTLHPGMEGVLRVR
jgi:plastocyanin